MVDVYPQSAKISVSVVLAVAGFRIDSDGRRLRERCIGQGAGASAHFYTICVRVAASLLPGKSTSNEKEGVKTFVEARCGDKRGRDASFN